MFREGLLMVVSGPSGAGKGTILERIKSRNNNIRFSVSATTRKPRDGEVDGKNYFFKTTDEFELMINNCELIEWVKYCDNYYGTPKKYIEDSIKAGIDIILEIEVEGAVNIKKMYPDSVLVFILPPSFEELKKRIEGRGSETADTLEKRLSRARQEVSLANNYEYVIINDDIEEAVKEFECVLVSEKLRCIRNSLLLEEFKGI